MTTAIRESFRADYFGGGAPAHVLGLIDEHFADRGLIQMLDAGCGDRCRVRPNRPVHVVGIDSSAHQLQRNVALDEAIVADMQSVAIEHGRFDLIVCWDVLEHLPDPLGALDRLAQCLARAGLLVLAWPSVDSAKAVLARRLPHPLHVGLVRCLYPEAQRGPDCAPFATVLHPSLAVHTLVAHLGRQGLELSELVSYESEVQRKARRKLWLTGRRWEAAKVGLRGLSGGRLDAERTDLIAVFANAGS